MSNIKNLACCVQIIDVGTQRFNKKSETKKNGTYFKRMIFLGWETESPTRVLYKKYELSIKEGTLLRRDVEKMFGEQLPDEWFRRFDLKKLLGKYCKVIRVADKNPSRISDYKVNRIVALPVGSNPESLFKPITQFNLFLTSEPNMSLLESFPAQIQDLIKSSSEFTALNN
jgi:hypothetical protein